MHVGSGTSGSPKFLMCLSALIGVNLLRPICPTNVNLGLQVGLAAALAEVERQLPTVERAPS